MRCSPRLLVANSIFDWVSRHVLLNYAAYRKAEAILTKKIKDSGSDYKEECDILKEVVLTLEPSDVQRHQEVFDRRVKSIEGKARANLLAIALGVTVLFSVLNFATGQGLATTVPIWLRSVFFVLVVVAVGYLIIGGLMALNSLRLRAMYTPSLQDEAETDVEMRMVMASWAIKQNERTLRLRANSLSVSFDGIRNGIISLVLAFLLALSVLLFFPVQPI